MNIFNRINNELEELAFKRNEEQIEEIDAIGCVLYSNNKFNILVKYFGKPKENEIREEAIRLREALYYLNYNIWNSYYLVCVEDSVSKDFTYLLEKETKGLRKYVIKSISDFDRIPFFDKSQSGNDFEIEFSDEEGNAEVAKILELVKRNNGLETNLTNQKVNEIIQEFTGEEES
ncbi:ABC-three component system middle component 1 [Cytobacillus firmus]|uniref:ABC-three component system middle component 1 n=1 Tax=Cytobacillus firmus TaxID=1399 RepID=UPI001C96709A|nr:ABC-three component system middle component 1 [Cytobacillus firmus]MBY6053430.1 hypothetical protein [Cytobacillus firmus]